MKLQSPAKLNLFLRVLGKRPDGYHELASLFQTIDLFDEITFTLSPKDRFTCSDPSLPLDENNLVMKALKLFRKNTNVNFCAEIHLEKRIPIQAGLGGGSGNAATTLWGLNELTGRPATLDQLVAWAGELGSDVPFFLTCGTAYCTGRGEVMRPLEPLDQKQAFIVKPAVGLSTPTVFRNYNAQTVTQRDPEMQLKGFLERRGTYFNDWKNPHSLFYPYYKA